MQPFVQKGELRIYMNVYLSIISPSIHLSLLNYIPNYGGDKVKGIWGDLAEYTFLYSFDL